MHTKWREGNRGSLYILNNKLEFDQILPSNHIHLPNGSAWSGSARSTINEVFFIFFSKVLFFLFFFIVPDFVVLEKCVLILSPFEYSYERLYIVTAITQL